MIVLQNVSKAYKDLILFEDVSLTFPEGKKIFIKGINGSGKSVLLKMLVGYATPDAGTIQVDGLTLQKEVDFMPDAGVFINAPEFMKNWSGLENLTYLADIRKVATEKEITQLADYLQLDLSKKYRTYSLGMRQKMRLIQAFMDKPRYLVLDEPFDALDKESKKRAVELMENFLNESTERTLIFTSHNELMEDFADITYEIEDANVILAH